MIILIDSKNYGLDLVEHPQAEGEAPLILLLAKLPWTELKRFYKEPKVDISMTLVGLLILSKENSQLELELKLLTTKTID
jgi:hypothetical protein